jgi:ABC-type tungstate transport system permease subunit
MERASKLKEVPQEEIDKMEYIPKGKHIGAIYLHDKNIDILKELNKYPEMYRSYIIEGIQESLLQNLHLPFDKSAYEINDKVKSGLLAIKKNKNALKEIFRQIDHLFNYYEQTISQAYLQFKENYSMHLKESVKAVEKKLGTRVKIDPEKQPGFHDEWVRFASHINSQYEKILQEQKNFIRQIK